VRCHQSTAEQFRSDRWYIAMIRIFLISTSIASIFLSVTSAEAAKHRRNGLHAVAATTVMSVSTVGSITAENHQMYLRNLRASGYNPKNDYTSVGTMIAE